jgi:hypothetical protein
MERMKPAMEEHPMQFVQELDIAEHGSKAQNK